MYTVYHEKKKRVPKKGNLYLVNQIIQQNTLVLTNLKSNTVHQRMVNNPLHIKMNSQLNDNTSTSKI